MRTALPSLPWCVQRAGAALVLAACAALAGCGGSSDDDGPTLRTTAAGKLQGIDDSARNGTWAWKGVRYAEPPVGALRWRAPVEPARWAGVRAADSFGPACLQIGRMFGPGANNRFDETIASTMGQPLGSEDCLTLNIWRPATGEAKLPVLLFIHGGSNISGYTADPLYDGAALAKAANAVVVTANYRLGVLGFLNLPQLRVGGTAGDDSGNFALLDNMAALRWLRGNAAAFGGDADNITVSGESAGANNVLAVMTSPMAKGLFHKIVALSGGISLASNLPAGTSPALSPLATWQAQGELVLLNLLVADGTAADLAAARTYVATRTAAQVADYLRGKDGKAVLATALAKGLNTGNPIPDGTVVPTDPIATIAAGQHVNVPTLIGNTRDEGKLFGGLLPLFGGRPSYIVDDATRFLMMARFDPDAATSLTTADIVDASYLPVATPATGYDARTGLITRLLFEANSQNLLSTLSARQPQLWQYRFDWAQEAYPWNEVYGAAHAFDLAFLFGNFGPSVVGQVVGGTANRAGRLALSNALMASLGAFMRTGNPNATALGASWSPWPSKLLLDATPTALRISAQ
ncbi:carboxylesterase/lipase family protein [Pseudorhodoferax sp. Leaf274]|uniref:carboxylesterase/lipase family protein n=1 Tax=Pseudorhodoferax sp. Leaf274 TaxID=1736318 RepID=UPI00070374B7|nr:carboxylesterase family protein [Pseudorhodoferax sp. Leaf274]KQP38857.1 carboxylesterase [Pseudorhodoferax sp. Leaf274]